MLRNRLRSLKFVPPRTKENLPVRNYPKYFRDATSRTHPCCSSSCLPVATIQNGRYTYVYFWFSEIYCLCIQIMKNNGLQRQPMSLVQCWITCCMKQACASSFSSYAPMHGAGYNVLLHQCIVGLGTKWLSKWPTEVWQDLHVDGHVAKKWKGRARSSVTMRASEQLI